jgi:hypothetical protein
MICLKKNWRHPDLFQRHLSDYLCPKLEEGTPNYSHRLFNTLKKSQICYLVYEFNVSDQESLVKADNIFMLLTESNLAAEHNALVPASAPALFNSRKHMPKKDVDSRGLRVICKANMEKATVMRLLNEKEFQKIFKRVTQIEIDKLPFMSKSKVLSVKYNAKGYFEKAEIAQDIINSHAVKFKP